MLTENLQTLLFFWDKTQSNWLKNVLSTLLFFEREKERYSQTDKESKTGKISITDMFSIQIIAICLLFSSSVLAVQFQFKSLFIVYPHILKT